MEHKVMKHIKRGIIASIAVVALVVFGAKLFAGLVAPPPLEVATQLVEQGVAPDAALALQGSPGAIEAPDNVDNGTLKNGAAQNTIANNTATIDTGSRINAENNTSGNLNAQAENIASLQNAEKAYRNTDAGRDQRTALAVNPNGGATGDVLNLPHGNVGNTD